MKAISTALTAGALAWVLLGPAAEASGEKVLYSFCGQQNCADGDHPSSGLIYIQGMLYGTTGADLDCAAVGTSCGTVFSLDPQTGVETVLHPFQDNGTDGWDPVAGLINVNGKLYGTTAFGGSKACHGIPQGCGTVFSVDLKTGTYTVLHDFKHSRSGKDGTYPYGGLINVNGMLVGTTTQGGRGDCDSGCGAVFSLNPETGTDTVYSLPNTLGASPEAGPIDVKGMLYGTATFGGPGDAGAVFSVDRKTGVETMLHAFGGDSDGWYPYAGLLNVNGTLYGTTSGGPTQFDGYGTVFSLDLKTGVETVLHEFGTGKDGATPYGNFIKVNGTLYGTTAEGGERGGGTLFSYDLKTNTEKVVYSFGGAPDGFYPGAGVINVKGTLYGTTGAGGTGNCASGCGTVFAIVP